jgi:hypothetical protein
MGASLLSTGIAVPRTASVLGHVDPQRKHGRIELQSAHGGGKVAPIWIL